MPAERLPFFYGWLILGLGCLATSVAYGIRGSFSVFYVAILQEFGWSRADTALIFSMGIITYGLTAPVSGALIDRFGPQRVLPVGCTLVALGAFACSQATEIWQFYLFFAVLSVGVCLTAFVPYSSMLSRWFVRRRATAFGILSAGSSTSFGFLLISELLISSFGWRMAYVWLAALIVVVLLPLETFLPRLQPSDVGQYPDGKAPPSQPRLSAVRSATAAASLVATKWRSTDWDLGKALRTHRFWALFIANMSLWGLGQQLLVAHQVAFAVDLGFSATLAATMAMVFGLCNSAGALVGGVTADRFGREWGFTIGCAVAVVGVSVLVLARLAPSAWLLYSYAVIMGFGFGVASPALTCTTADLFAGRNFGSINGAMVMGFGLGGFVGPWVGGYIYDRTGDYLPAFFYVMGCIVVAAVFLWIAAPRQVRRIN